MNHSFVEHLKDILQSFGPITTRAMFGGYGIYKNGLIIGVIINSELYLKADIETSKYFESCGSEPLTYKAKDKIIKISYWKVLPEVLDQEELLEKWVNMAYASSKTKLKKK